MGFCPNCGASTDDGDAFCKSCGFSLQAESPSQGLTSGAPLSSSQAGGGRPKSVVVAMLLSVLFPGLGLFYLGEKVRGWYFALVGLILLATLVLEVGVLLYPVFWLVTIAYTVFVARGYRSGRYTRRAVELQSQRTPWRIIAIGIAISLVVLLSGIALILTSDHGASTETNTIDSLGNVVQVAAGQTSGIEFPLVPLVCNGSCSSIGGTYTLTGAYRANATITVYLMNASAYAALAPSPSTSYYYKTGLSGDIDAKGLPQGEYELIFDNTNGTAGVSVTMTQPIISVGP